jgi:Ca-activated chloride channel family protein
MNLSFLTPWRLVLLLGALALLAAYVVVQRRRLKTVVRFTSVDLLASVLPRRPGWQRHVSTAVLLGSLSVLVLGFARPARITRTPKEQATVILAVDVSGSMVSSDVAPSRLVATEEAASTFIRALPTGVQAGLVTFSDTASIVVPPTADRAAMLEAIGGLHAHGGTATGAAVSLALEAVSGTQGASGQPMAPAAIVLMSDGTPTIGQNEQAPMATLEAAASDAKAIGVRVNTIAFGTPNGTVTLQGRTITVPSDPGALAKVAATTGGQAFTAQTTGKLQSVYQEIGRTVGYDVHRRDISGWFLGTAILGLLLAGAAALVWNQRLV